MQYTPHYNLNLPEGTDIVNPLIQDNPNYSAIDTALYDNKLRVVGTATHTKTGTNHSIVLADSDIPVFRFIATGDYVTGDTFSVDGVTVTPRVADGSSVPTGAFKINSTVEAILDGTILNLINVDGTKPASAISYNNASSGLAATDVQSAIDELNNRGYVSVVADGNKTWTQLLNELYALIDFTKITKNSVLTYYGNVYHLSFWDQYGLSFVLVSNISNNNPGKTSIETPIIRSGGGSEYFITTLDTNVVTRDNVSGVAPSSFTINLLY